MTAVCKFIRWHSLRFEISADTEVMSYDVAGQ
jgi:hypothetical protein